MPTSFTQNNDEPVWFAMRVTYRRELAVKQMLDDAGVENFIPMRYEVRTVKEKKVRLYVPAVHNLIFVHCSESRIRDLKSGCNALQFMMRPIDGTRRPIIVSDIQMERFIRVAGTSDNKHLYFLPEELDLARGTRIRVHGGVFDGVEGVFVKVKGARSRRVVVQIQGVMAVAAEIAPDLLEVLPEKD